MNDDTQEAMEEFEKKAKRVLEIAKNGSIYGFSKQDRNIIDDFLFEISQYYIDISKYMIINANIRNRVYSALKYLSFFDEYTSNIDLTYNDIYYGYLDNLDNNIDEILNIIPIKDFDLFLSSYFSREKIFSDIEINNIQLLKKRIDFTDFKKSKAFIEFIKGIKRLWNEIQTDPDFENDNISTIEKIFEFGKEYIDDLLNNNLRIDFDNDTLLKSFPDKYKSMLKVYYLIKTNQMNSLSKEEIVIVTSEVAKTFDNTRESGNNFENNDRELLKTYFDNCLPIVLRELGNMSQEDLTKFYQVIDYIYRAKQYGFSSNDDKDFFDNLDTKTQDIIDALKSQKGLDDDAWSCILKLDNGLRSTIDFSKYIDQLKANDPQVDYTKLGSVKTYMKQFIDNALNGYPIDDEVIVFVIEYVREVTSKPDFNLFNEQYLCDILQLLRCNKLGQAFAINLEIVLDQTINTSSIDSTDELVKINGFIENHTGPLNETEFEEFLRAYTTIKISEI